MQHHCVKHPEQIKVDHAKVPAGHLTTVLELFSVVFPQRSQVPLPSGIQSARRFCAVLRYRQMFTGHCLFDLSSWIHASVQKQFRAQGNLTSWVLASKV